MAHDATCQRQHQTNRMIGNVRRAVIRHVAGNDAALARFLDIDNVVANAHTNDDARVFCPVQHILVARRAAPDHQSIGRFPNVVRDIIQRIRLVYPDFRTVAYNRLFVFRRAIEPRVGHKHQHFLVSLF